MDRNAKALTDNRHNYRLFLYTENKPNVQKTLEKLTEILALSEADQQIISNRVKNARQKSIVSLMDNLSWDDVSRIESSHHKFLCMPYSDSPQIFLAHQSQIKYLKAKDCAFLNAEFIHPSPPMRYDFSRVILTKKEWFNHFNWNLVFHLNQWKIGVSNIIPKSLGFEGVV